LQFTTEVQQTKLLAFYKYMKSEISAVTREKYTRHSQDAE